MQGHDNDEGIQKKRMRGIDKIWKFLERGMKRRPKSVAAMFDAEDKRKRKVRKNYPKFTRR